MSYVFTFDSSACSGCKACQVACKDKNDLPPGVLWRRVFEVSGGEWVRSGDAWLSNVFAYNFSMACNHCVHPKCAGVCPTNAFHVREDGIVLLDSAKCAGCGYCNWACPYAVPQYNALAGSMSKCDFCVDHIDAGADPACVAACPMRVLNFAEENSSAASKDELSLWVIPGSNHPFPLPEFSRTQPHMRLRPHPAMSNGLKKVVSNLEEIRPGKAKSEHPLLFFTLLMQMSVGAFWLRPWMFAPLWLPVGTCTFYLRLIPTSFIGICLTLGMSIALAHLGTKSNAWRMLSNLRKSWLSKEILSIGLFGGSWALSAIFDVPILYWLTAFLGFWLIYSMANVYYLRSMPGWNSWRTLAAFLLSAVLLGQFLLVPILFFESHLMGIQLPAAYPAGIGYFSAIFLIAELALAFSVNPKKLRIINWFRVLLILLVITGAMISFIEPVSLQILSSSILFLLVLLEESIGRWFFYHMLSERAL